MLVNYGVEEVREPGFGYLPPSKCRYVDAARTNAEGALNLLIMSSYRLFKEQEGLSSRFDGNVRAKVVRM